MTEILRSYVPELEIVRSANGGDGRTVSGIIVPYETPQYIPMENITEQIGRGAIAHQVNAAHRVRLAREHMMWGGTLIGRAHELRDDARGAWAALRVSATPAGDETLELIRDGALEEWSIGFREGRKRTLKDGTVERTKIHLFEVAVTMAGAYGSKAKISAVRSAGQPPIVEDDEPTPTPPCDALAVLPTLSGATVVNLAALTRG